MSQDSDTLPPKPKAVPVARVALNAARVGDAVPDSESRYRERMRTDPGIGAPFPAPPLPQPVVVASQKGPSPGAILARWAAPRLLALLASAVGGGMAAPAITGSQGRVEVHDLELTQANAEIESLRTRVATVETERRTDRAIERKQMAYLLQLWRERGNTEIRIEDPKFPRLPDLDIQAPADAHKPAKADTPFPTE